MINLTITPIDLLRLRRLAKEGGWIVIGQIVTVAGALALVRVFTDYLDPEQYGQLALGLTVAGLVNQVVMGGIVAGIGRYDSVAAEQHELGDSLRASRHPLNAATVWAVSIGIMLAGTRLAWGGGRVPVWSRGCGVRMPIFSGHFDALLATLVQCGWT